MKIQLYMKKCLNLLQTERSGNFVFINRINMKDILRTLNVGDGTKAYIVKTL